jgi:hypothetical protein
MVVGINPSFAQTGKGITMRSSQGNNKEKQTWPKVKAKAQANETRDTERKPKDRELDDTTQKDASSSPIGHFVKKSNIGQWFRKKPTSFIKNARPSRIYKIGLRLNVS